MSNLLLPIAAAQSAPLLTATATIALTQLPHLGATTEMQEAFQNYAVPIKNIVSSGIAHYGKKGVNLAKHLKNYGIKKLTQLSGRSKFDAINDDIFQESASEVMRGDTSHQNPTAEKFRISARNLVDKAAKSTKISQNELTFLLLYSKPEDVAKRLFGPNELKFGENDNVSKVVPFVFLEMWRLRNIVLLKNFVLPEFLEYHTSKLVPPLDKSDNSDWLHSAAGKTLMPDTVESLVQIFKQVKYLDGDQYFKLVSKKNNFDNKPEEAQALADYLAFEEMLSEKIKQNLEENYNTLFCRNKEVVYGTSGNNQINDNVLPINKNYDAFIKNELTQNDIKPACLYLWELLLKMQPMDNHSPGSDFGQNLNDVRKLVKLSKSLEKRDTFENLLKWRLDQEVERKKISRRKTKHESVKDLKFRKFSLNHMFGFFSLFQW